MSGPTPEEVEEAYRWANEQLNTPEGREVDHRRTTDEEDRP